MDISVVIPLYNHEQYIEETIDSVLSQTVRPKEIIIIDDGSKDSSLEKAQAYEKKYPDLFTVIGQKNRGAHATINRGILMAKSELISILNSDDNYLEERFAECIRLFEKDPDLSAMATGIEFIDKEGKIIESVPWYEDAVKFHYDNNEDFFLSLVNANFFMTTSNFIFKKEIIADIGLFADLRYAHDYDFFFKCVATGHKIIFHDRPLVQYRMHDSNTIRENLAKVLEETVCVIGKFLKYTDITGYKNKSYLSRLDTILTANHFSTPVVDAQQSENTEKNKFSDYYNPSISKYFTKKKAVEKNKKKFFLENNGYCPICETEVTFRAEHAWLRDNYLCTQCGSVPRERALMEVIKNYYPNWRGATIHESSPGGRGTSIRLQEECEKYIPSQYFLEKEPGEIVEGVQCQNLEALTFDNGSIDIHITQDVMEHVFHPDKAFSEIARTLSKGGMHIFTVPLVNKFEKTKRRARIDDNGKVTHLLEPSYHGNPIGGGESLVTIDWGVGIADYIFRSSGLFTQIIFIDDIDKGIRAEYIEVLVSKKSSDTLLIDEM